MQKREEIDIIDVYRKHYLLSQTLFSPLTATTKLAIFQLEQPISYGKKKKGTKVTTLHIT